MRDQVSALLAERKADVVDAEGAYALPFPVLSAVDAAALAVVLEDGAAAAWVRVLDQAAERSTRELAVGVLSAAEVRAVGWRVAAGKTPVTSAVPRPAREVVRPRGPLRGPPRKASVTATAVLLD